jgi:hypothetical protein
MEADQGIPIIWYDTLGRIPIRIAIPAELTAPEAKAALAEFVSFLDELSKLPHADTVTMAEAYKMASDIRKREAH